MLSRFSRAFLLTIFVLLVLATLAFFNGPSRAYVDHLTGDLYGAGGVERGLSKSPKDAAVLAKEVVGGGVIMSKLGNATAKAALGQATWKLLHTMTLRFPENPTADEREALNSYFHLTSRLYPCGECAAEFQQLLRKFPPQTSSRKTASLWLCHVHNQVNARLGKPEFDCAHLDETYDCGCGDDPLNSTTAARAVMESDTDDLTGAELIKGGR